MNKLEELSFNKSLVDSNSTIACNLKTF